MPEALLPLATANVGTLSGLLQTVRITDRNPEILRIQSGLIQTTALSELDSILSDFRQVAKDAFVSGVAGTPGTPATPGTPGIPTGDLATLIALKQSLESAITFAENLRDTTLPQLAFLALTVNAPAYDALRTATLASLNAPVTQINGTPPNFSDPLTNGDGDTGLNSNAFGLASVFSDGTPAPQRVAASTDFFIFPVGAAAAITQEYVAPGRLVNQALPNLQSELANVDIQIAALGGIPPGTPGMPGTPGTPGSDQGFEETDFAAVFDSVRDLFADYSAELSVLHSTGVESFRNVLRLSRPELFPFIENGARSVTGNVVTDAQVAKRLRSMESFYDRSLQTILERTVLTGKLDVDSQGDLAEAVTEALLETATDIEQFEQLGDELFDGFEQTFVATAETLFTEWPAGLQRDPTAFAVAFAKTQGFFRDPAFAQTLIDVKA